MGFVDSVKTCYGKYATFSGRAPRSEYWWFSLASILCAMLISAIFSLLGYLIMGDSGGLNIFGDFIVGLIGLVLFAIFNFLPMLSVTVRRLHDTGRSGWWCLIVLLPFGIQIIAFLSLLFGIYILFSILTIVSYLYPIFGIWFLVLMLLDSDDENRYGLPVY